MKIGVVTIYNSQNCGSYLQAYALTNYIKSIGHEAALVKNNMYYKNKFLYRAGMALKYALKFEFAKAKNIYSTYSGFKKARKKYAFYTKNEKSDMYVFGSDTIWNVDGEYFCDEWKHYFGFDFSGNKITYAASVGPADIGAMAKRKELCQCINDFDAVSVRDHQTFEFIKDVTGKDAEFVVDPTMLMDKFFYENMAQNIPEENYILFYCFEPIETSMLNEIKKYAQEKGLKLICFGDKISGCNKQLIFNPYLMMSYYKKASFVVTDTFHGNVFSLIFNKPFMNIERGKAKVTSLLDKFSLSGRTADNSSKVIDIMEKTIDFDNVNKTLADYSNSSKEFLKSEISKIERRKK